MKQNRTYLLTVGVGPYDPPVASGVLQGISLATETVTIKPPLTLEFDIRREFLAAAQNASLRIKNLNPTIRNVLYKDRFASQYYARVTLQAGYENAFLTTIFDGTVWSASSTRYDRDNIVTEIEGWDGGFAQANSMSAFSLPASFSFSEALQRLNGDLVKLNPTPIIGTVPSTLGPRARVFVGGTFDLITKLLPPGVSCTIDNSQLLVLADNDVLQFGNQNFIISAATGLLDPPVREGAVINVKILFEPRITLGQLVLLDSEVNPIFNGNYQVRGISHSGIISGSEGGPATTTLQLWLGDAPLNILKGAVS